MTGEQSEAARLRVGLLGVGSMGAPILRVLGAHGFHVDAFDPSPERLHAVTDLLPKPAGTAAALAGRVDVVITVLPGPRECEEAMLGEGGALAAMGPGSCWLDLTSNDPKVAERISDAAAARGIDSVAAPMQGGPEQAAAGALGFYLGGSPSAIERVRPVLRALGEPAGTRPVAAALSGAYVAKLLANGLWFSQVIAVTEALLTAQGAGIAPERMREVLAASPGGSAFLSKHASRLIAGDYMESFGLDRVVEELDGIEQLGAESGTATALVSLVASLHREALAKYGPVGGELLGAKLLEERTGRALRER